jgi:hypothetical protein
MCNYTFLTRLAIKIHWTEMKFRQGWAGLGSDGP